MTWRSSAENRAPDQPPVGARRPPGITFLTLHRLRRGVRLLIRLPSLALIGLVRAYQFALSPLLGGQCRFEPSCSRYFIEAVRKHGALRGGLKGLWRICRCNPWTPGGFDPP